MTKSRAPKTTETHQHRADRYERFLRELLAMAGKAAAAPTGSADHDMFAPYAAGAIAAQLKTREELNVRKSKRRAAEMRTKNEEAA